MISLKIFKILSIFRFNVSKVLFNKSSFINFRYSNVYFQGHKRISMGKKNTFQKNSNIIIDHYSNNQNISIGNENNFASYSILKSHGGYISIGNNNFVGEKSQIQGRGGVEIGDNVLIAPNCFISSSNHDYENPDNDDYLKKEIPSKTKIEDKVWIGANCVIVAGVTIGTCSIVAGGSVVTKDVEPYTIVAGNPARVVKTYNKDQNKWIGIKS